MMCVRSIGIPYLRVRKATSRADDRYIAFVYQEQSPTNASCSMPIDVALYRRFPECQAMSCSWTICVIAPSLDRMT